MIDSKAAQYRPEKTVSFFNRFSFPLVTNSVPLPHHTALRFPFISTEKILQQKSVVYRWNRPQKLSSSGYKFPLQIKE
jgi:hypothetical protein